MLFLLQVACLRLLTTFNKCGNLFLFSVLHLIFPKGKSFTNSVNDLCFQVWDFWSEQFWTVLYQLRKWKASAAVYTGKCIFLSNMHQWWEPQCLLNKHKVTFHYHCFRYHNALILIMFNHYYSLVHFCRSWVVTYTRTMSIQLCTVPLSWILICSNICIIYHLSHELPACIHGSLSLGCYIY